MKRKIMYGAYVAAILALAAAALWPKPMAPATIEEQHEVEIKDDESEPGPSVEEPEPIIESYPATRMTHYVMDGKDAGTCIAGRWCIGKQLTVADDTDVMYDGYHVFAVHCSVIKEWRGTIIKVYYTDGGVETGIILDCGGFAGHKDRMDKAMGARYNGERDNYTLSRYIEKTEVIRKGW